MYNRKSWSLLLLVLVFFVALVPLAQASSITAQGTFGTAPWKIENGVLTISAGQLANSGASGAGIPPWKAHAASITSVVVEDGVKTGTSASHLFSNLTNVVTIDASGLDTSAATSFTFMFQNNRRMTEVNVTGFDLSAMKSLNSTFHSSGRNLNIIGLDTWDVSKITGIENIFRSASIKSLAGIEGWDTSSLKDLNSSFLYANVSEARLLDLSKWTTSNITSLHYTFWGFSVNDLTIKNWNLSSYLMLESAFSTTMTRLELGAWKNASTAIPNPSAYGLNDLFRVYPKVIVLNSEFKFYPNDSFTYSPPSNDTYSGRWQAVGAGTEEKPLGESYSISQLRALYPGGANNGPDETYVWERAKVTIKATKSWEDNNNQDRSRPASVTVELLANSAPTGVLLQLSAANAWTGSFEPQNKVDEAGAIITYTVKEQDLDPNYTVAITGDAANGYILTNTYEAPSVVPTPAIVPTYPTIEVPLSVKKVLRNGSLKAGEFTFELRDSKGQVLAEAKNAANGDVVFPNRTFSKAVSNYIYTIREVPGKNENITYDKTVYTVKVTTTPQNGVLVAKLALEKDGVPYAGDITFTNQRKPVKTGDDQFRDIALLLSASLLVLGGAQVLRKRKDASK